MMRFFLLLAYCSLIVLSDDQTLLAKEQAVPRVAANNALSLQKLIGRTVTVHGKVNRASISKSGHHFLNFYSSNLTVVCFQPDVEKFEAGGPAKLWRNKEIEVSGKLELYKGKPQIKLTAASQVKLAGKVKQPSTDDKDSLAGTFSLNDIRVDTDAAASDKPRFELKQTGRLTWMSPAGLVYRGRDAQGLTRVEHVLRHAADQPGRQGSHGVFEGGNDKALAVVDEAWELVKTKKIEPKKEGDRLAYTVPMGRRIGFLGGKSGANRKHPPLTKVFLVIRKPADVITAFPRS